MSEIRHRTGRLLRTRRLELGLSHREAADLAGVTRTAIDQVEHGAALDAWPHASVRSLLAVLQLSWGDLEPPSGTAVPSRVAQIGAELARSGRVGRTEMVGDGVAVVDELRSVLAKAGMTVVESADGWELAPDAGVRPLPRAVRKEDERIVVDGPNAVESEILHAIVAGHLDPQRLSRSRRRALATLVRSGLVEEVDGDIVPSASTRRTLLLE